MGASVVQRQQLRRMIDEASPTTYSDSALNEYIERYPVVDAAGYEPDDDDWTDTYNLYLAAADICEEKAATASGEVTFQADGASFNLSEKSRQWLRMAEQYRGRATERLPYFPT